MVKYGKTFGQTRPQEAFGTMTSLTGMYSWPSNAECSAYGRQAGPRATRLCDALPQAVISFSSAP